MSKKMKLKSMRLELDKTLINAVVQRCGKKATWSALDHLAAVSKQQVPLDTGTLMNSCAVSVNEDGTEGTVSYDTPYAVEQHENRKYNHQRGRKAKYLEDPCNDSGVQSHIVELMRRVYEGEM